MIKVRHENPKRQIYLTGGSICSWSKIKALTSPQFPSLAHFCSLLSPATSLRTNTAQILCFSYF